MLATGGELDKNRIMGAIKNWGKGDLKFRNFNPVHSSQANDGVVEFRALRCQDCAIKPRRSFVSILKVRYLRRSTFILTPLHLQMHAGSPSNSLAL